VGSEPCRTIPAVKWRKSSRIRDQSADSRGGINSDQRPLASSEASHLLQAAQAGTYGLNVVPYFYIHFRNVLEALAELSNEDAAKVFFPNYFNLFIREEEIKSRC
jgi:hypothetical protein